MGPVVIADRQFFAADVRPLIESNETMCAHIAAELGQFRTDLYEPRTELLRTRIDFKAIASIQVAVKESNVNK